MRSNFQIRIRKSESEQCIEMHCTRYQANKALVALSYCLVESDVQAIDLYLMTRQGGVKVSGSRVAI